MRKPARRAARRSRLEEPAASCGVLRRRGEVLLLVSLALGACSGLCACSGLPAGRPDAGEYLQFGTPALCSLGLEQDRSVGVCRVAASGDPLPIVIRRAQSMHGFIIRSGDEIDFPLPSGAGAGGEVTAPADRQVPPARHAWRLQIVHAAGPSWPGKPLTEGSLIRLRSVLTRRYLAFEPSTGRAVETPRRKAAALIEVYKADFANPDRPSTCDPLIRDDDYVYLRTLSPGRWLREGGADADSVAPLSTAPAASVPLARTCVSGAERCRTDDRGAVQCAVIPCCGT
ncbi:MAG TPA: hypothetical protein VME42_05305 [Steroidobacteraceae bacterium]|nr:hypothetical protein [Steroidobacteraceae bacterium]